MKTNNRETLSSKVLLVALSCCCCLSALSINHLEARSLERENTSNTSAAAIITTTTTITTTNPPEDQLATAPAVLDFTEEDDSICLRCYNRVVLAQSHIAIYSGLEKEQKKLIATYRQQQIDSATITVANPIIINATNQSKLRHKSTTRNPTNYQNDANKRIVVSSPRVVRSVTPPTVDGLEAFDIPNHQQTTTIRQRDPALKRLKHRQEKQLDKTCKSLHDVQQCLNEISRECIGDLQYHSHEVLIKQWLVRLNCPPVNDPGFKPYSFLLKSIPVEEREKVPLPRPITSEEETKKRLDAIFEGKSMGPFGVMLKQQQKLTRSTSQKFDLERPLDGLSQNEVRQIRGRQSAENLLVPLSGQLLLISCLLVLMIALITMTNRYFKR